MNTYAIRIEITCDWKARTLRKAILESVSSVWRAAAVLLPRLTARGAQVDVSTDTAREVRAKYGPFYLTARAELV